MEARAYPRCSLRVKTDLVCVSTQTCHQRYVRDISLGGLFVNGSACGPTGMQFSVLIRPLGRPLTESIRYPAHIVRATGEGFALSFDTLDSRARTALGELVNPKWDGKNVIEGLLIVAAREQVMSLSECLRLTSVICDHYRRVCALSRLKSDPDKTGTRPD